MNPLFSNVPLDLIKIPDSYIPTFHRKNTCEAIRVSGIMMPVVVKKDGERYVLIDGLERLNCAKEFGWQEVPALIVDDERVDVLRLALNYVRGKVCGVDVLMYVFQLSQQYDNDILSKVLGRGYETVRKYKRIAEHMVALGLSKDEYQKLHNQCTPLRRLISCLSNSMDKDDFWKCLGEKPPRLKKVTPEAVKHAVELQKDPRKLTALEYIDTIGLDRFEKLMQAVDLFKKNVCPNIEKVPEEMRGYLKAICDLL